MRRGLMAVAVGAALGAAADNAPSLGGSPAQFLVESVLLHRAGLQSDVDQLVGKYAERLERLDRPTQDTWLRAALLALTTCTPLPNLPA